MSESLVGAFDKPGADVVVIEEDAGFPQERREARRVGKILLKFLMSAIADVGQAIGNTDDFVAVGLSFHERNEVDVAVRRNRAPNAGPHQNHTDEIAPTAATDVAQGHRRQALRTPVLRSGPAVQAVPALPGVLPAILLTSG